MKNALLLASLLALAAAAGAQTRVRGYATKRGTYVAPHERSAPNRSKHDNYSSKGNINPYTGKSGTVDPAKPTARKRRRFGL